MTNENGISAQYPIDKIKSGDYRETHIIACSSGFFIFIAVVSITII